MTKERALELIDGHKNKLISPAEMLHWTVLRVIILKLDDRSWWKAVSKADKVMNI